MYSLCLAILSQQLIVTDNNATMGLICNILILLKGQELEYQSSNILFGLVLIIDHLFYDT
jgi:hypothetical protein